MEFIHFNQRQLATRWNISEVTLERWHSEGVGPKFMKLRGRLFHRQVDIEACEKSRLATSTRTVAAQASIPLWVRPVVSGVIGWLRHAASI